MYVLFTASVQGKEYREPRKHQNEAHLQGKLNSSAMIVLPVVTKKIMVLYILSGLKLLVQNVALRGNTDFKQVYYDQILNNRGAIKTPAAEMKERVDKEFNELNILSTVRLC